MNAQALLDQLLQMQAHGVDLPSIAVQSEVPISVKINGNPAPVTSRAIYDVDHTQLVKFPGEAILRLRT